jgi:hypothetical protein
MSVLPPPCGLRVPSSLATASFFGRPDITGQMATFVGGGTGTPEAFVQRLDQLPRANVFDTDNKLHKKMTRAEAPFQLTNRIEHGTVFGAGDRPLPAHAPSPGRPPPLRNLLRCRNSPRNFQGFCTALTRDGSSTRQHHGGSIATSNKLIHDTAIKTERATLEGEGKSRSGSTFRLDRIGIGSAGTF